MTRNDFYEITAKDIGHPFIHWQGVTWSLFDVMGPVQACDVGKRIYYVGDGVLQVESEEQKRKREEKVK
jgi:hypothetical protein